MDITLRVAQMVRDLGTSEIANTSISLAASIACALGKALTSTQEQSLHQGNRRDLCNGSAAGGLALRWRTPGLWKRSHWMCASNHRPRIQNTHDMTGPYSYVVQTFTATP